MDRVSMQLFLTPGQNKQLPRAMPAQPHFMRKLIFCPELAFNLISVCVFFLFSFSLVESVLYYKQL